MTQVERVVKSLIEDGPSAEEFMRDVGFDSSRGGATFVLKDLDLIEKELDDFKAAVIRRTGEIMPHLVRIGIVNREDQASIVAKLITYYTAEQQYNPKRWHDFWQRAAKRINRYIANHMSWSSSNSRL